MQDIKTDDIENLNPLTDTGKALKQMLLDRLEERRQMEELQARVKRLADAWDAEHTQRETWLAAAKQAALLFLSKIGWR